MVDSMNRIQCSDKQSYDSTLSILETHMNYNNLNGGLITNDEEYTIIYDFFPRTQDIKYEFFESYMKHEHVGYDSNGKIINKFTSTELYNIFTDWWNEHYSEQEIPSHTKFGTELVKCTDVFRKKTKKANIYIFTSPEIFTQSNK